uniref:Calsyntenin-1 n=1 Tax=Steinernema glaseri TaxID=37863 RepID=A0A1I7YT23_9BILA
MIPARLAGPVRFEKAMPARLAGPVRRAGSVPITGPICKYELTAEDPNETLPFEVEVIDKTNGNAVLQLSDGYRLDCAKSEYRMRLAAVRCGDDSSKSESVSLKVNVKDVNNHSPEFEEPWYTYFVDEGKADFKIARLVATDKDCGYPYGQICRYEISNALDGFPFEIDDQGVLRNTRALNYTDNHSYILTILAHDCGMKKSKSTLVTVNVRPKCVNDLVNIGENVELSGDSENIKLAPTGSVHVCPEDDKCVVKSVEAVFSLTNGTCAKETLINEETVKRCKLHSETVNLLPRPEIVGVSTESSLSLEDDDDDEEAENLVEKTDEKYLFDGKSNAVIVPANTVKGLVPERFSLTFAMKHAKGNKAEQSAKQNILCESDDFNMNRHHFAVYLRHCKLEMLLRREAESTAEFRAAEWRWNLAEVCDNQWHTYVISFAHLDEVHLYVDGRRIEENDRNPEILDDWPLHKTSKTKTRLVVGACWHGRTQAMAQFFSGHLSSMYYLPGQIEKPETVACMHECHEQLKFGPIDDLLEGEEVTSDIVNSRLSIKANNAEDLTTLLRKVSYENTSPAKSVLKRPFEVTSTITCKSGTTMELPRKTGVISVSKSEDPLLSITGQAIVDANTHDVKTGATMLKDIQIIITKRSKGQDVDVTSQYNLEWCKVHMKPSRDMDLEYFSSPAALISSLHVDFEHDKQGILLKGAEKVKGYREILSKIHYFNTRPEAFNQRMYTVQCALEGGKVLSSELFVTMNIDTTTEASDSIDKVPIVPHDSAAKQQQQSIELDPATLLTEEEVEKHFEPTFDQLGSNRLQNILEMDLPRPKALLSHHYDVGEGAIAGGAVAVVVVVCVGFLLVLLVIGVLKMRDAPVPRRRRNRKGPSESGMEWDDSGLNITVNPLEDVEKNEEEYSEEDEEEESSDGESYRDEEELTEDEEENETEPALPHTQNGRQGLEWDDSNLSNVSRTYRV